MNRLCLLLIIACVLGLFWIFYLFPLHAYREVMVSSGQQTFTAKFSYVTAVIPCNNDPSLEKLLDEKPIRLTLRILDSTGNPVGEVRTDEGRIHTNSYISTEQFHAEGLPVTLNPGENYSIQYEASCDGMPLEDLSFAIYDEGDRALAISGMAALLCLIAGIVILLIGRERTRPGHPLSSFRIIGGCLILWLAVSGIFVLSVPKMNVLDEEREAFANAYAVSSMILGKPAVDGNGNLLVEEEGIRNSGNLSYIVPVQRFWTDWSYGNERAIGHSTTLFRTGAVSGQGRLLVLIDGTVMAAARGLHLPYQMVYLSGPFLNAVICLILLCWCLRMAWTSRERRFLFPMVNMAFLMPAMIQGIWSCQGSGLCTALGITYGLFCLCASERNRSGNQNIEDPGQIENREGTGMAGDKGITAGIKQNPGKRASYADMLLQILLVLLLLFLAPAYLVLGLFLMRDARDDGHLSIYPPAGGPKKMEWIAAAGGLAGIVEVIIHRILLTADSGPGAALSALFNTLTAGADELFYGAAYRYYFGAQNIRLSAIALLILLTAAWFLWQRDLCRKAYRTGKREGMKWHGVSGRSILIFLLGILLVVCSGSVRQSAGGYYVYAGVSGVMLLPLLLVPFWRPARDETEEAGPAGSSMNSLTGTESAVRNQSEGLLALVCLFVGVSILVGLKCIA